MTVTQAELQTMLKDAKDNWDFENSDDPYNKMEPQIDGMIGADLSEDQEIIDEYVSDPNDFDGLQDYVLSTMGRF
ncbi:MAG: hypothetical protein ACYTEQ_09475 [Planctomycetota bacterium]|jgi:hypothetical protein